MTWDYVLMNPPYGSVGGDTLHLKFTNMVYDKFNKKMIIIMPFGFVTKDTRSFKKYQEKFAPKLQYVKEIDSSIFDGTGMANIAIYEFTNNETDTTIIEDISGNKTKKSDLSKFVWFTYYEQQIVKYLENQNHIEVYFGWGGYDRHWRTYKQNANTNEFRTWLDNNIKKALKPIKEKHADKFYLLTNNVNGSMNAKYMTSKCGQIIHGYDKLFDYFRTVKPGYYILIINSELEAKNLKDALNRPLLRLILLRTQIDRQIYIKKTYKYIPDIDWEDDKVKTDEGILELCGCPKDKCKEYADYCKNIFHEN